MKTQRPKPSRASLTLESWPAADREAWQAACRPGIRLEKGGRASHLRPVSQKDLAQRYGSFLGFLQRQGLLDLSFPAGGHVIPEHVEAYLAEARTCVSSVTQYNCIRCLRRIAQLIAPHLKLAWLSEIENDLAMVMVPRSKFDRLVLSDVLIDAGMTLMQEAESAPSLSALARARQYRDGLMVAMLTHHPIRLKNFYSLEIGRTFVEIRGRWWIVLSAAETKEARPDERPVSPELYPAIEQYRSTWRPIFARGKDLPKALWLSSHDSAPMSYSAIENAISKTTLSAVGVDVSPHLFRTSAVSTAAILCGDNPNLGSALLHHAARGGYASRVTQEHYNRASSLTAGYALLKIVRKYKQAI